jgi:iodotyrosine deiodinase
MRVWCRARHVEHGLLAASTAPSRANQQPWFFSVITDPVRKRRIRLAAEKEKRECYGGKAPQEWLDALAPLGTDLDKPFLEEAPILIAEFAQKCGVRPDGSRYSLLVVGQPTAGCQVPVHGGIKKPLQQIAQWLGADEA